MDESSYDWVSELDLTAAAARDEWFRSREADPYVEVLRAENARLRGENDQLRADLASARARLREVGFSPRPRG